MPPTSKLCVNTDSSVFDFQINRDVSLQSFLTKNKVFSDVVQYDFEPCRLDKVSLLY